MEARTSHHYSPLDPDFGLASREASTGRRRCLLEKTMNRLSVLVTTSYYWPEAAGSGPYLTGVAEHLSKRGHDVVVVTGFAHYPDWRSSARGRLAVSETRAGVTISRRWHYVPRTQSAVHRALYEASLFGFGLTALPARWRPNVILGTCPSLAGGALAAVAARLLGAPYGLVFQDLMGLAAEQSGVAGGKRVAGLVRKLELGLAARADGVAIIAEGFRGYLEEGGVAPDKIHRLRNWTRRVEPTETASQTRRRLGWEPADFICLHGGNIGQKQGLDNLLDAAALLVPDAGVRIVLAGDGNDRARLRQRARELGLANVDFIELQGPGRWEAIMQASDVLLVNQRPSVTDMSLPSKLTSYFAAARPVVAAASAGSETAREIEAAGAGVVVPPADASALRAAILSLKADRARANELGRSGRKHADSVLSSERNLQEYEEFLHGLMDGTRGSRMAKARASRQEE
jgi:colanic acid biosynthesis glycosyl transferase WcaI